MSNRKHVVKEVSIPLPPAVAEAWASQFISPTPHQPQQSQQPEAQEPPSSTPEPTAQSAWQSTVAWSYGITASPQRVDNGLLLQTVKSLAAAGFNDPTIFMDGACDFDESWNGLVNKLVIRTPGIGHLPNWMTSLVHLYCTAPKAVYYALFEDDLICCKNLRQYLESCEPPNGYWNLLTHDQNIVYANNVNGWHESNQRGRGAVGLVFPRDTLLALIRARGFFDRPSLDGEQNADGMVITCLRPLELKEYIHFPSLVQHMGLQSVMNHKYGKVRAFVEDYDPVHDFSRSVL